MNDIINLLSTLMRPCSRGEVSFPRRAAFAFPIIGRRLFSFGDKLRDARVDACVDNQALVRAWQSQAARSSSFSDALKELSNTVLSLNLHLSVFYISSRENPADHPS